MWTTCWKNGFIVDNFNAGGRALKQNIKFKIKKRFLVLLFIFGYVAFNFGHQFWRINQLEKEIANYNATKVAVLEEQKRLQEEIDLLQNKSYIERVAREQLGLIKPGEVLLVPAVRSEVAKPKSLEEVSDNIH